MTRLIGVKREELEQAFGKVWDENEVKEDFDFRGGGFGAVTVIRKSDGHLCILYCTYNPTFYFGVWDCTLTYTAKDLNERWEKQNKMYEDFGNNSKKGGE